MENVEKKEDFNQVCVWPSTIVSDTDIPKFEEFFKEQFGVRVQFLEEYKTQPDLDENGDAVKGTGGRSDALFAIHKDDVGKFCIPRLQYGIRWIEDAIDNNPDIYEARITEYRTW